MSSSLMETLRDLAAGRVQRSRHGLVVDGVSHTKDFMEALELEGYKPMKVRDVEPPAGIRYPAFVIRDDTADFGYVFHEKFADKEWRVLFGSVVRDWIGDWEIMLTRRSLETVWVNLDKGVPFDEDRPSDGL